MANTFAKRFASVAVVVIVVVVASVLLLKSAQSNNGAVSDANSQASVLPTTPTETAAASRLPASPTAQATQDMSATISPSEHLATQTPVESTEGPTPSAVSEQLALSDAFWDPLIEQPPDIFRDYEYESLNDLAQHTELIVTGHIVDMYVGEIWKGAPDDPGSPHVFGRIAVDEVLSGTPKWRVQGFVEMELGLVGDDWQPPALSTLPGDETMFFLKREAKAREEEGSPPRDTDIAPFAYFATTPESIVRDIGGSVTLIETDNMVANYGADYYPLQYEGTDFDQFVSQVRTAIGHS